MGLHHKLCHVLGGTFGLPHAETHTVVLPYALAYNAPAAPDAMAALGRALATDSPAQALWDLSGSLGVPRSLAELGLGEADLTAAAAEVTGQAYPNPRETTAADALKVLRAAYGGDRPAVWP